MTNVLMDRAMINWPVMFRYAEGWANGLWVGAAAASLAGIVIAAAALLSHAILKSSKHAIGCRVASSAAPSSVRIAYKEGVTWSRDPCPRSSLTQPAFRRGALPSTLSATPGLKRGTTRFVPARRR